MFHKLGIVQSVVANVLLGVGHEPELNFTIRRLHLLLAVRLSFLENGGEGLGLTVLVVVRVDVYLG